MRLHRGDTDNSHTENPVHGRLIAAAEKLQDYPNFRKAYAHIRLRPHASLHTVFEYIVTQPRTTLGLCDANRGRLSPIGDLILDEADRLAVIR